MKKLTLLLVLFMPFLTFGQNEPLISYDDSTKTLFHNSGRFKSHINLEFASSANAYFTEGAFDELSFKMNRVRLEILGRLNDNLSYHFRQSFNKYSNPYSVDNMSSSIEYAYIKWHHEDKFELVAGKQFLAVNRKASRRRNMDNREFNICLFLQPTDQISLKLMGGHCNFSLHRRKLILQGSLAEHESQIDYVHRHLIVCLICRYVSAPSLKFA